jgi:hypothetical protein
LKKKELPGLNNIEEIQAKIRAMGSLEPVDTREADIRELFF